MRKHLMGSMGKNKKFAHKLSVETKKIIFDSPWVFKLEGCFRFLASYIHAYTQTKHAVWHTHRKKDIKKLDLWANWK